MVLWITYLTSMLFEMTDLNERYNLGQSQYSDKDIKQKALIALMVQDFGFLFLILQGFALGIVKLDEPNYRYIWKKELLSWFGLLSNQERPNLSYSNMQKGLATELVFAILTTICDHTMGECKREYQDYDFDNIYTFTIDSLAVKDPKNFIDERRLQRNAIYSSKVRSFERQKTLDDMNDEKLHNYRQENVYEETSRNAFIETQLTNREKENHFLIDKEIKCSAYAPDVFAKLRNLDNIEVKNLRESLNPELLENVKKIKKAGEGMGKSGSFFFFSHDDRFLIKTMTTDDFEAFMKLFRTYFEYITETDRQQENNKNKDFREDSLLARIYGVYKIEMEELDPVYLILMGNTK